MHRVGQKSPPISFSPVTFTNVGLSPQNFLTSSLYLVPVPSYWTWTKTTPQKKCFFWSNLYKIVIMITSLIEMLQWPKKAWSNQFCWHHQNCNHVYSIKKSLKTQKKLKELEIIYSKICWFPMKKCWCQQKSRGVSRD